MTSISSEKILHCCVGFVKNKICQGDSRNNPAPSCASIWLPARCGFGSRPAVCLPFLEGILQPGGGNCEPLIQVLPPVQRTVRKTKSRIGEGTQVPCVPEPSSVEQEFPQECPLSSACMGTNHLLFLTLERERCATAAVLVRRCHRIWVKALHVLLQTSSP